MTFSARQVLTAAQLNNLDITTLTTSGTVTVGAFTLPATDGTVDQVLVTDGSGTVTWQDQSGGGGTPGGSDGQIQYNDGGAFGGASSLYYDDVNSRVGINDTTPTYTLDVNGTGRFTGDVKIEGTTPILEVEHSADSGVAEIRAQGTSQGTGALFAGQSNSYGGGVFYNGDGSPAYATGEDADRVSFFRRNAGTNEVVFSYPYNSNVVTFRGDMNADGHVKSEGADGGGVMRYWTASTAYTMWGTANMTGDEYAMLTDGLNTFISAGAGGTVHIRGGNNDTSPELTNNGTNVQITGTVLLDVVSVSNEIQAGNGSSTDPSYTFSSDGDTGMYRVTTNTVGITCGGVVHYFNQNGLYLSNGDWFRTTGQAGWYSETYNGGIYMIDSTWVRTYNNKAFYTSNNLRGDGQIQTTRNSTGNISGASINLGLGNGSGVIFCMNAANYGPLITIGQGEHFYVRNYLNSSYAVWDAVLINRSSIHDKHNIMTLGEVPRSAGSASNPLEAFDAMEKVRQLRPVSYQWHEQNALPRMPCHEDGTADERRINALSRLNKIRKGKGLGEFQADYLKHKCGRDCEHTLEEPCFRVKNYRNGKIGFIAQEVGELIPAAAHLSEERDEPESVDPVALVAIVTRAVQQLDERVSSLEQV